MSGCFVAVVGPSGAGKDSLIAAARTRLAADERMVFARRVITRAEGGNEDHDSLDPDAFAAAEAAGAFALSWCAHGLSYGIPATIRADVAAGRIVVANLSRAAVDDGRRLFGRVRIIAVTAPPAVLAHRLAGRGRESEADILARLAMADREVDGADVLRIVNDGPLDLAVSRFVDELTRLAQ